MAAIITWIIEGWYASTRNNGYGCTVGGTSYGGVVFARRQRPSATAPQHFSRRAQEPNSLLIRERAPNTVGVDCIRFRRLDARSIAAVVGLACS